MGNDNAAVLLSRADRLFRAGQTAHAIRTCEQLLATAPNHPEALSLMGILLSAQQQHQQALSFFSRAARAAPNEPAMLLNVAKCLRNCGDHDQAAAQYQQIISRFPGFAPAYAGIGNLLLEQGRTEQAAGYLRAAVKLAPDNPAPCYNLSIALEKMDFLEEAMNYCNQAIRLQPDFALAINQRGNIWKRLEHWDEALHNYRHALTVAPHLDIVHVNMGNLYSLLGETALAEEQFRNALDINPTNANAWLHLTMIKKGGHDEADIATMEELTSAPATSEDDRISLHFALGKAYDDLHDYARAAHHYERANSSQRRHLDYDAAGDRDFMVQISRIFSEDFIAQKKNIATSQAPHIFIVGMPRSGTTLTERILAMHPAVTSAGESTLLVKTLFAALKRHGLPETLLAITGLPDAELAAIGSDYLAALRADTEPGKVIIDKMPHNFFFIGLIRIILPGARIIHCIRHPIATCLSCYQQKFTAGHEYSYDLRELGTYYRHYEQLMSHWQRVFPGELFPLRYEELVTHPEQQIRALLEFCGLDWQRACLDFHTSSAPIKTASLAQANRPLFTGSISKWEHYRPYLAPLLEALDESG